jgi:phage terminase large subunit-like protein
MNNYQDLQTAKIYEPSLQLRAKALLELRQRGSRNQIKVARSVDESIDWIKTEFFIPELNGPIELYPYQEAVLREAYRKDADGKYIYSIVVYSDIKKSAKSSIAGAVALERMSNINYGSVKIIGNDIKQADSRTAEYARRAVQLNKRLDDRVDIVRYKMTFDNQSTIEAIPIDPTGEAGGNDDLIIYTEAWGLKDKADIKMWEEQRISPTKFGKGQIWVESYAGYEGESPILWNLYEYGVLGGKRIDEELGIPGLEVYRNGSQLTLWNTQPRLPWQTQEYYASESSSMTDTAFNRVHRNQWQSSVDKFVPDEWWAACKDALPNLYKAQPMILAADAAESDDCFGLVLVSRHDSKVAVRYARKWQPEKGKRIIYVNPDNPDDTEFPEGEIRRLSREFNIVELAYDKFQLHDMMNRLRIKPGINCRAFKQGDDRAIADKQLYDLIKERRIIHSDEVDLAEHIKNANKKAEGENKVRLVKRQQHLKIDLGVCLSMGAHRALKLNI